MGELIASGVIGLGVLVAAWWFVSTERARNTAVARNQAAVVLELMDEIDRHEQEIENLFAALRRMHAPVLGVEETVVAVQPKVVPRPKQ